MIPPIVPADMVDEAAVAVVPVVADELEDGMAEAAAAETATGAGAPKLEAEESDELATTDETTTDEDGAALLLEGTMTVLKPVGPAGAEEEATTTAAGPAAEVGVVELTATEDTMADMRLNRAPSCERSDRSGQGASRGRG